MSQPQIERVRRLCVAFPETEERLSHGESTFFVRQRVFAMMAINHHNDGRIAVWLSAPPGIQAILMHTAPQKYFKPPFVGVRGWIGVNLEIAGDDELEFHLGEAWRLVAPKRLQAAQSPWG